MESSQRPSRGSLVSSLAAASDGHFARARRCLLLEVEVELLALVDAQDLDRARLHKVHLGRCLADAEGVVAAKQHLRRNRTV